MMKLVKILIQFAFLVCGAAANNLVQLEVNSGSSSTIYNSRFPLEKSWDENPSTFFHSRTNRGGWAKYNIPESNVKLVRLQNRADCCQDRMTNNIVYVCADGTDASCQECGRVTGSIGKSQWAEITCDLRGSVVKVVAPTSYLQIAQIEVFSDGTTTPAPTTTTTTEATTTAPALVEVPVNSGSSSTIYDSRFPLEKSWDDNPSTFFHSRTNRGGWAKYNIPESNVKLVRLQNRADCCEDRMSSNIVYVCADSSDASCQECGRVTEAIGRSQWAEITCDLRGSVVKVVAPNTYLQIAQIEIFSDGTTTPSPTTTTTTTTTTEPPTTTPALNLVKVPQSTGIASAALSEHYSLDKAWDNIPSTFFHSAAATNGWAKFNIPISNVRLVRLQNRLDCCTERMTGNIVYVCYVSDDKTCTECGRVTESIGRNEWADVYCEGGGLRGFVVKVQAPNSYLQIAQIEIWADGPPTTTRAPTTTSTTTTTPEPTTTSTTTTTTEPTTTTSTTTTTPEPTTTSTTTTTTEPTTTTTSTTATTSSTTLAPLPCQPQFADTDSHLEVASCTSMEVKDHTRACENMFDGSLSRNVKEGVCFVTKSNYKGWVEVKLAQTSVVSKLVILSKGNGENLAGTIVSVCMDVKKNCQRFGKIYTVKPDKCTILKGDVPKTGNMVRFFIAGSSLAICELRIYGTPV